MTEETRIDWQDSWNHAISREVTEQVIPEAAARIHETVSGLPEQAPTGKSWMSVADQLDNAFKAGEIALMVGRTDSPMAYGLFGITVDKKLLGRGMAILVPVNISDIFEGYPPRAIGIMANDLLEKLDKIVAQTAGEGMGLLKMRDTTETGIIIPEPQEVKVIPCFHLPKAEQGLKKDREMTEREVRHAQALVGDLTRATGQNIPAEMQIVTIKLIVESQETVIFAFYGENGRVDFGYSKKGSRFERFHTWLHPGAGNLTSLGTDEFKKMVRGVEAAITAGKTAEVTFLPAKKSDCIPEGWTEEAISALMVRHNLDEILNTDEQEALNYYFERYVLGRKEFPLKLATPDTFPEGRSA